MNWILFIAFAFLISLSLFSDVKIFIFSFFIEVSSSQNLQCKACCLQKFCLPPFYVTKDMWVTELPSVPPILLDILLEQIHIFCTAWTFFLSASQANLLTLPTCSLSSYHLSCHFLKPTTSNAYAFLLLKEVSCLLIIVTLF